MSAADLHGAVPGLVKAYDARDRARSARTGKAPRHKG
jgi:hypothetical protein